MPALYTTIGPWTLQTFTLALALTIALSAAVGLRRDLTRADAYLAALVGGIIGARLFHVLLNFDYFADNLNEAFNLNAGGLDWHGAVIGGVIGLGVVSWWSMRRRGSETLPYKNAYFYDLVNTLTLALPLIGLGAWYGCLAAGCGYGREVDTLANYSPLVASELVDVFGIVAPRYNTPFFGIGLSILALLVALLLIWRRWLQRGQFWFILALLSVGMFVIGFFRADHSPVTAGLRADQWLDVGFLVVSGWLLIVVVQHRRNDNVMSIETAIQKLEQEWEQIEPIGFFGKLVHTSEFDEAGFSRVQEILNSVEIPNDDMLDKRFVEVTWFIPTFMRWQQDAWRIDGKDTKPLDRAIAAVEQRLTTILGLP